MTTCLSIAQCSKCEYPNKLNCFSCSKNHTLDTATNTCKCQNNPPCGQYETCVQETSTCLHSNLCMKSPFCKNCSEIDPTWCSECVPGYEPDIAKQCKPLKCNVENCLQCDPSNEKCVNCVKWMSLSENNTCECEFGSNKGCAQNQTCNSDKKCEDANICLKETNCVECDDQSPENCCICGDGYVLLWGTCQKSSCQDKMCNNCDEGDPTNCYSCQNNYQKSPVTGICECGLGSDQACPEGSSCSKERRICITDDKCKDEVLNCSKCWFHDQQLCGQCQDGYFLSNNRKSCMKIDLCMSIKGCQRCNSMVPSMCAQCNTKLIGMGESCASNKLSAGGITGIVVAVVVVIGVIIIGLFLIRRLKNKYNVQAVVERPQRDYI